MKRLLAFVLLPLCLLAIHPVITFAQNTQVDGPVITSDPNELLYNVIVAKPRAGAPFADSNRILTELMELLVFDLQFSGAFQVYTEDSNPQALAMLQQDRQTGQVNYPAWQGFSINDRLMEFIVDTELVPRGAGYFALNMRVYDIARSQMVIGRAYGGEPHSPFPTDSLRRAGHKATADIIREIGEVEPITETKIAFVNNNKINKTQEVYTIDYDGHPSSLTRVTAFNTVTHFPDWSPDGAQLTYATFREDWSDCYVHTLSTGDFSPVAKYMGTNTTPRFWPDGGSIVASISAWGDPEIARIPKLGGKVVRLTEHPGADIAPDVHPVDNRIVFTSDRGGNAQIYIMNADGTNPQRISYINRNCDTAEWSPVAVGSEHLIAFSGFYFSLQSDIFTTTADGQTVNQITDNTGDNKHPTWSPNGNFIAFCSNRLGGKYEIYIASSDPTRLLPNGKRFHRITTLSGDNLYPSWSPN